MVNDPLVYLFTGEDFISQDGLSEKDRALRDIKEKFLKPQTEQFNLDILQAKDLSLNSLQEKLLAYPVRSEKRIIIVRSARHLSSEVQEFILSYAEKPNPWVILVIDIEGRGGKNWKASAGKSGDFIRSLLKFSKPVLFKENIHQDAFMISRHIRSGRIDLALRTLKHLLDDGQKPELILGALRHDWADKAIDRRSGLRSIAYLLDCDFQIKTSRLKPQTALEKLIISLSRC